MCSPAGRVSFPCLSDCLCGQVPSVVKSTQTRPRYAGPFVTCSGKLSYNTTKGERLCVISSWLHQSGGKPHWVGHPELVISNHRACQDSISLMANWTNANEAGKTSFRLQRENPSAGGSRGGEVEAGKEFMLGRQWESKVGWLWRGEPDFSCKSQGCSGQTLPLSP